MGYPRKKIRKNLKTKNLKFGNLTTALCSLGVMTKINFLMVEQAIAEDKPSQLR